MWSPARDKSKTLAAALIIAVGLGAYWNSFHAAFVFDDEEIAERMQGPVRWAAMGPRPVVGAIFALNGVFGGLSPAGYRVVNLAIHTLAALTLFGIVRRTLENAECRTQSAECRMDGRRRTEDGGRSY